MDIKEETGAISHGSNIIIQPLMFNFKPYFQRGFVLYFFPFSECNSDLRDSPLSGIKQDYKHFANIL